MDKSPDEARAEHPRGMMNSEARKRKEERAAERSRQVREATNTAAQELAAAARDAGDFLLSIAFSLRDEGPQGLGVDSLILAAGRRLDTYFEALSRYHAACRELVVFHGDAVIARHFPGAQNARPVRVVERFPSCTPEELAEAVRNLRGFGLKVNDAS